MGPGSAVHHFALLRAAPRPGLKAFLAVASRAMTHTAVPNRHPLNFYQNFTKRAED